MDSSPYYGGRRMNIHREAWILRNWIMMEHGELWDLFEDLLCEGYFEEVEEE
jgi:hypothetical protein